MNDTWQGQLEALGSFIRAQRQLSKLTLRQMAELTKVSNPYLSQVERGLHEPSMRVLNSIAAALNLSTETLLAQIGLLHSEKPGATGGGVSPTEAAIRVDPQLTDKQREALLAVYRSFLTAQGEQQG